MKKLIPLFLLVLGTGGGVGAGLALRPEAPAMAEPSPYGDHDSGRDAENKDAGHRSVTEPKEQEYVKLNNQFVVPVVSNDLVDSLVVMSLSIEIASGQAETVYQREPKLRDSLLQVLFDHANMGGFRGEFTNSSNLDVLRAALTETAQGVIGNIVSNVLITDIARQDI